VKLEVVKGMQLKSFTHGNLLFSLADWCAVKFTQT